MQEQISNFPLWCGYHIIFFARRDRNHTEWTGSGDHFNPHAPYGAWLKKLINRADKPNFNPHAPYGAWQRYIVSRWPHHPTSWYHISNNHFTCDPYTYIWSCWQTLFSKDYLPYIDLIFYSKTIYCYKQITCPFKGQFVNRFKYVQTQAILGASTLEIHVRFRFAQNQRNTLAPICIS